MKDVMLDLETLGTRHNAMIIQIGACYFDRETGEIGFPTFKANIKHKAFGFDFTVDYDTVAWWFAQSDAARSSVLESPVELVDALLDLSMFLNKPDIKVWSHATFDMPILMNAFDAVGIKSPIPYRNTRDIRTLMDLSQHRSTLVREGTHHDALADAVYQAKYVSEALRKLV